MWPLKVQINRKKFTRVDVLQSAQISVGSTSFWPSRFILQGEQLLKDPLKLRSFGATC